MGGGFFSLINGHMVMGAAIPLVAVLVFFLHEVGHYVAARLCRVHVERITVGIGRTLWTRTDRNGTLWTIRVFPVCGFIQVAQKTADDSQRKGVFCYQPLWKRALIVAAGPLTNIVLAWFMFVAFFALAGQPSTPPYIAGVEIGGPAEEAGFLVGDQIVALNGKPVQRYEDVLDVTHDTEMAGQVLSFVIKRGDNVVKTDAQPISVSYTDDLGFARTHGRIGVLPVHYPLNLGAFVTVNGLETGEDPARARALLLERMDRTIVIGIRSRDGNVHEYTVNILSSLNDGFYDPDSPYYERVFLGRMKHNFYLDRGLFASMKFAFRDTTRLITGVTGVAGRIGRTDRTLVEPETWVSRSVSTWKHTFYIVFYVGICLSVSIALMNLLPIPGFDGSMLLRYLLEAFTGPERAEVVGPYASRIALLFLAGALMVINLETLALFMK